MSSSPKAVLVYENLHLMLGYRGLTPISARMEPADMMKTLNINEYVEIHATGPAHDLFILLLSPTSIKYAKQTADFKKLIAEISRRKTTKPKRAMIVAEDLGTHIKKYIGLIDNLAVEHHTYDIFLMELPKHKYCPRHIIASDEEIKQFCDTHYVNPRMFPKIYVNDAMAVWIGAQIGDCVRVERISENAGLAIIYRLCIPVPIPKK